MDALDSAIIRHLGYGSETFQWDLRASLAKLARVLSVDEDTVRTRVRQLEERGIITGWSTIVHPGLFGREAVSVEVPGIREERKAEAVRSLQLVDGVYAIFEHFRAGLFLAAFHEPGPPLERFTDLVATICDARAEVWPNPLPPVDVSPDATDWRVLQAMRRGPRRPVADLAASTGLSARTIQRRLNRLIKGRAAFVSLKTDFSRMTGLVPVQVRVVYSDGGDRGEVVAVLREPENPIYCGFEGPMAVASFMLPSVAEAEALAARLRSLPGAERVRVDVQTSRITVDGWMDEALAARIAERNGTRP